MKKPKVENTLMDLEKVMLEMVDHGMQWGDILFSVYGYLMIHCPGAREEYDEGGNPEFYYGPRRDR